MTVLPAELTGPQREQAREQVRAAAADCRLLLALLPAVLGWSGPAELAFGLRIAGLRAHIEAAAAALAAAEDEL